MTKALNMKQESVLGERNVALDLLEAQFLYKPSNVFFHPFRNPKWWRALCIGTCVKLPSGPDAPLCQSMAFMLYKRKGGLKRLIVPLLSTSTTQTSATVAPSGPLPRDD